MDEPDADIDPDRYQRLTLSGAFQRNNEHKRQIYSWILSDQFRLKYSLGFVALMLFILVLHRGSSMIPDILSVLAALISKALVTLFLFPGAHLAYVFELYLMSLPLLLLVFAALPKRQVKDRLTKISSPA